MLVNSFILRSYYFKGFIDPLLICPRTLSNNPVHDKSKVKSFDEIPGPKRLPLIGNIYKYRPFGKWDFKNLHKVNMEKYKKYGKIIRENLFGLDTILLFDPNDIETVLRNEGQYPKIHHVEVMKKLFEEVSDKYGIPIAFLQGKEWYRIRFVVQEYLLRPKNVTHYMTLQDDVTKEFVNLIQDMKNETGEVPFLFNQICKYALEAVAVVAFNDRLHCLHPDLEPDSDAELMVATALEMFYLMHKLTFGIPLWKVVETPSLKRLRFLHRQAIRIAERYVNKTLDKASALPTETGAGDNILMSLLSRKELDTKDTIMMAIGIMFAGIDTTSNVLGFGLYHFAKNPEVQAKLYEEIIHVIPDISSTITPDHLNQMPYLKACVKEILRLNPIGVGTARVLPKDLVLSGYFVPSETTVLFQNMIICQLEEFFQNANQFQPERWLSKKSNIHPYCLLPFGTGPRMCLGRRFAEQELYLAFIRIIQTFEITYHYEDIGIVFRIIAKPDKPLRLTFVNRM